MRFSPPDELRRLALFAAVGVVNTLLSLAVYATLLAVGARYLLAAPAAFAVGALNGYLLNARFTFRRPRTRRSLVRCVLAQTGAAVAADVLLWALVATTSEQLVSYLATVAVVAVASFLVARTWVFVR